MPSPYKLHSLLCNLLLVGAYIHQPNSSVCLVCNSTIQKPNNAIQKIIDWDTHTKNMERNVVKDMRGLFCRSSKVSEVKGFIIEYDYSLFAVGKATGLCEIIYQWYKASLWSRILCSGSKSHWKDNVTVCSNPKRFMTCNLVSGSKQIYIQEF